MGSAGTAPCNQWAIKQSYKCILKMLSVQWIRTTLLFGIVLLTNRQHRKSGAAVAGVSDSPLTWSTLCAEPEWAVPPGTPPRPSQTPLALHLPQTRPSRCPCCPACSGRWCWPTLENTRSHQSGFNWWHKVKVRARGSALSVPTWIYICFFLADHTEFNGDTSRKGNSTRKKSLTELNYWYSHNL